MNSISFERFCIDKNTSLIEALKKIDSNKKGFLIIIDSEQIIGTVTDGDIRRQLILNSRLDMKVDYKKDFEKLYICDNFATICEKFKSDKIAFLPVLDKKNRLVNILTKKVFHTLLLHDINWNLTSDFSYVNDNEIDFEVFSRPWGFYKSTLISDFVQSKVITVFPKGELSLQEHKKREEHWVIIKGEGKVVLGESVMDVYPGRYIYIPKGCKHQLINDSEENIIFSEVQLGAYFGEDDIIRYSDKYGRVKK